MKPCKRIEIVIEEALSKRLMQQLEAVGAPGYTLIPRASGSGDRGIRRGDDPSGAATNCVFIIACENDAEVEQIVEAVRPLLSRSGGICLVSDAHWVRH
ncbi:MAG: nitrogen regulatory protein PII [Gammaproteobacteria bacterium]|jgi:nitrogen regulatory protein PII